MAKGKKGFQPGESGNPGGRPKRTQEELDLVAACKAKTSAALAVIEQIMERGENERNRMAAAMAIIERGHGKPVQPIEQNLTATVKTAKEFTDDELAAYIATGGGAGTVSEAEG